MPKTHLRLLAAAVVVLAAGFLSLSMTASAAAPAEPALAVAEQGEEVRSTMTMKDVETTTGVPRDYIVKYLNLPGCVAGDKNKPAQEWLSKHGLSIVDLREAVARYRAGHRF